MTGSEIIGLACLGAALFAAFQAGRIYGEKIGYAKALHEIARLSAASVLRTARQLGIIQIQPMKEK